MRWGTTRSRVVGIARGPCACDITLLPPQNGPYDLCPSVELEEVYLLVEASRSQEASLELRGVCRGMMTAKRELTMTEASRG